MTSRLFPFTRWNQLSVPEVERLFCDAPFAWGLAGGYAVEQFLGTSLRAHDDTDIVVFREDQHQLYHWLHGWQLFAADPPGTLRPWIASEWLAFGIHDIWGHRTNADAWQLQIMLLEADGEQWFSRRDPRIRGVRQDLLIHYRGIPCMRIEVQLLYKAKGNRAKDQLDFQACLPLLTVDARTWLIHALRLEHPDGHEWLTMLSGK